MPLLSQFRVPRRGQSLVAGESPTAQSRFEVRSPTPDSNNTSLSQHYAWVVQDLRTSVLSACRWLSPEDVDLVSEHPIAAGGFANIHEAKYGGRKVVLKSYRCYESFDVARVVARFCNEVYVCSLLQHEGVDVVPLMGVYSTETHPFGLVYEYMGNLDLKQHLRNDNAGGLKLLTGIARCLSRMHDLGIAHGNLRMANTLVSEDGTVRIGGLSNAATLSDSTTSTVESRTSTNGLPRGRAPGLISSGVSPELADPTRPTKAGDVYDLGATVWEVLTGRPPFSEVAGVAAAHSMLSGARPPRPNNREIPDRVWYMIEQCWHQVPSKRMSAGEAADLLETELRRISGSCTLSRV